MLSANAPHTTEPFVSICLLTYKRADLLHRSLDALLGQTYRNFELIINDDCSPDHTAEVARAYEARDNRVRYCRNETNQRYAGNQNAALSRAKSDLVAIVHDGDVYQPDCIEQWVQVMQAHPNVGLVYNTTEQLDERGRVTQTYRHPYPRVMNGRKMVDEMLRLYSSPIFGIVMVRKSYVERVGYFDEQFPILADVDMWMRLLLISDVGYVDKPLYQIAPREADHANRGVNWKIVQEHYRIFEANTRRRFVGQARLLERALRALERRADRYTLRAWLSCLKHRQWGRAAEGCQTLTRSSQGWLWWLGQAARPLLLLLAR